MDGGMTEDRNDAFWFEGAAYRAASTRWGLWWMPGMFRGNARYRLDNGDMTIETMNRKGDRIVDVKRFSLTEVRAVVLYDTQDTWCCRMLCADGRWVEICSLVRKNKWWEDVYPAFCTFIRACHQDLARCNPSVVCRRGHPLMRYSGWAVLVASLYGGGNLVAYRMGIPLLEVQPRLSEGAGWAAFALGMALGFRLSRVGGTAQPALGVYDITTPPLR